MTPLSRPLIGHFSPVLDSDWLMTLCGQDPCLPPVVKEPTNGYWANIEMGSALCPYIITGQRIFCSTFCFEAITWVLLEIICLEMI